MEDKYDNIILIGHCLDDAILFYKYINERSLVVLLTEPRYIHYYDVFQELMEEKGCTFIKLNEIETFDINYKLPSNISDTIKRLLETFDKNRVMTHTSVDRNEDPQNRALYDLIKSMKLNNHIELNYNDAYNETIDTTQIYYINKYAKNNKQKIIFTTIAKRIKI